MGQGYFKIYRYSLYMIFDWIKRVSSGQQNLSDEWRFLKDK